jgi:hypothetical protein
MPGWLLEGGKREAALTKWNVLTQSAFEKK